MAVERMLIFGMLMATLVEAEPRRPTAYRPPETIEYRTVDIVSEGVRLSGELFIPKQRASEKLPTLVMSHGWGGQASLLRPDAVVFAQAGYLVITFDYRGWGASDGRLVATGPIPASDGKASFSAEVRELREMVDPHDQICDLMNVLHWSVGEPLVDIDRLGVWGTSYSGGHVVYAAAKDPRVRALVSQVGAMDSRMVVATPAEREKTYAEATARARGEIDYPPPGQRVVGNLKGAPIREKMMRYAPVEMAGDAPHCAMLFILAEKEELFDNNEHGIKAHAMAAGPKKLVILPNITHYGVYLQARKRCQEEAITWLDEHLKPARPADR
jgi:dienelactone hydrolase